MTWLEALTRRPLLSSVFQFVPGPASQDDNVHDILLELTNDPSGTNQDLFHKQQPLTREMIIAVLEARVQRRLC